MKKKVIIIGSGVSGLVAGVYALLGGLEVEIFESHSVAGGNCTGWNRKGYHIDGCIQWLTGTKKGTGVNKIWQTCGVLTDESQVYNTSKIASTIYEGKMYHLYSDLKRMKREFLAVSPEDKVEIKKLIKNIRCFQNLNAPVVKPFEQINLFDLIPLIWKMIISGKPDKKTATMTIEEYLNVFKSPIIRQLLFCAFPIALPAYTLFYNLGIRSSGDGGWPVGGSQAFIQKIQQRFEDLGGKIHLNTAVDKIIIAQGTAVGVRLMDDGREAFADYIVPAVDAKVLMNQLLDGKYSDDYFEKRFTDTQNYMQLTGSYVSLGVSSTLENYPHNVYIPAKKSIKINNTEIKEFNVKIYNFDSKFTHPDRTVMTVLLTENEFDFWKSLKERSVQEYVDEKNRIAAWIKENIIAVFSELADKIEILDMATPLTYNKFCNSYRGTYMSYIPFSGIKMRTHKGVIKDIRNLYLAGQCTIPVGGLPLAAVAGKFAAQRILKNHKP